MERQVFFDTSVYRRFDPEEMTVVRDAEWRQKIDAVVNPYALLEIFAHLSGGPSHDQFNYSLRAIKSLRIHAMMVGGYRMMEPSDCTISWMLFQVQATNDESMEGADAINVANYMPMEEWPPEMWAILKKSRDRKTQIVSGYKQWRAGVLKGFAEDRAVFLLSQPPESGKALKKLNRELIQIIWERKGQPLDEATLDTIAEGLVDHSTVLFAKQREHLRRGLAEARVTDAAAGLGRNPPNEEFMPSYVDGLLDAYPVALALELKMFLDFASNTPRDNANDVIDSQMLFSAPVQSADKTLHRFCVTCDTRVIKMAKALNSDVVRGIDDYLEELGVKAQIEGMRAEKAARKSQNSANAVNSSGP